MPAALKRLAILDDYQGVAQSMGPWDRLPPGLEKAVARPPVRVIAVEARALQPSEFDNGLLPLAAGFSPAHKDFTASIEVTS